ncbi:hypothetical protein LCGC14_0985630 [marine sediment metagenome]|uniref:Uncharacterized protein n=1 Tax=marine sediment metagenome TaxID=412755 RepID=A0A0F9NBT7_9ZZZZ
MPLIKKLFCFLGIHVYPYVAASTFGSSCFIPECRCIYCNYDPKFIVITIQHKIGKENAEV